VNILIVKLGSIGDVIHTLPSLAAIRDELPNVHISWIVEERSAEILRGNQLIDSLVEIDTKSLRKLRSIDDALPSVAAKLRKVRKGEFDVALDFQGLMKSGLIAKLSGAKRRWGFARKDLREPASRMFLTDRVRIPADTHIIRKNLALTRETLSIEVPDSGFRFPIHTTDEHRSEAQAIAIEAGPRFAILNPAAGWTTKMWPAQNFGRLADKLWFERGIRSVIVTGPRERELSEIVAGSTDPRSAIFHIPTIKGFFELARKAALYVGGDTGPTHLAVAAGAPIVGLFGPTEWWRNGSPNADDICVERMDIGCRVDCHRRTCSKWICMDSEVDTVYDAAVRRLALSAVGV
jgi:heptosyltransferase-1